MTTLLSPGKAPALSPLTSRPALAGALTVFGVLFCAQWAVSVLAFPAYKGRLGGYLPVLPGVILGVVVCLPGVRRRLTGWLIAPSRARFLLGVALLALALRLAAVAFFPMAPVNDPSYFHRYAEKLLAGGGYGGLPWPHLPHLNDATGGPLAFYPPGMTFLLAGVYAVTGPSALAGKVFVTLLSALTALVAYDIGRRAVGERAGRWAAVIVAVCPTLVFYCATVGYETALGLAFALLADLALVAGERPRWWHLLLLGVLSGAITLLKPVGLLLPALLLVWWLAQGAGWRSPLYAAVTAVALAAVVAPWTYRNSVVLGDFVPVSTNGGYVLRSANHDDALGIHMALPALPGEEDEVTMDRLRSRAAVEWIKANPGRFLELAGVKTMLMWGTSSTIMSFISCDRMPGWQEAASMAALNTAWVALLVACLLGTARGAWARPGLLLAWLLLAYSFALQLVFESESRHHIPVVWALALLAACGLSDDQATG